MRDEPTRVRAIHDACLPRDGIRCVSRQMNNGSASAIFGRSVLELRAEKLEAPQADAPCDWFNATAV
jgi:hypothetical protein